MTYRRIKTEHDRSMRKAGLDIPEIRHEQGVLPEVPSAEARASTVLVEMNVNHRDGLRIGRLQRFAKARAADGRTRRWIVHVVSIFHVVDASSEQEE